MYIKVRLSGRFAPNRRTRKVPRAGQSDRQLFMPDGKCRQRVIARVVSTLNQSVQPRSTSGLVAVFTTPILKAVEVEVPSVPRRQRKRGWCESAETPAAFKITWIARENARQFLRSHPRDRIAWKKLRTACANLHQVVAAGVHAYFEEYLAEAEKLLENNDQRGFYKHPEEYCRVGRDKSNERAVHYGRGWCAAAGSSANS